MRSGDYNERAKHLFDLLREIPLSLVSSLKQSSPFDNPDLPLPNDLPDDVEQRLWLGRRLDSLLLHLWRHSKGDISEFASIADREHLHRNDYELMGTVGHGQFGKVTAVRSTIDGGVYALKSVEKFVAWRNRAAVSLSVERYLHLLALLDTSSTSVPKLHAAFQDEDCFYLLTDYAPYGSLWDRMCSLDSFEDAQPHRQSLYSELPSDRVRGLCEDEVLWWLPQMVLAIAWIHGNGFVHRDIKPHNFLIFPHAKLMLTDLGSAAPLHASLGETWREVVPISYCPMPIGTPDYIAPEIMQLAELQLLRTSLTLEEPHEAFGAIRAASPEEYGSEVDWWSLGVTVYEMIDGRPPFWKPTVAQTYQYIQEIGRGLPCPAPTARNPELVDFVQQLLRPSSHRVGRICTDEVQAHSVFRSVDWLKADNDRNCPSCVANLNPVELDNVYKTDSLNEAAASSFSFGAFFSELDNTSMTGSQTSGLGADNDRFHSSSWSFEPLPVHVGVQPQDVPVTPRPTISDTQFTPTVPKSTRKTRMISTVEARRQLYHCATQSARKRLRLHWSTTMPSDLASRKAILAADSANRLGQLETWHQALSEQLDRLDRRLLSLNQGANVKTPLNQFT